MTDWTFVNRDNPDELPLHHLFFICSAAHLKLNSLPSDLELAQKLLFKIEGLLQSCGSKIDSEAVFSRNEELDDVPTDSLRYFLVPFFQADVLNETRESARRLNSLRRAKNLYLAFLSSCDGYSLLHQTVTTAFKRFSEEETGDPSQLRREKIEQRRQETALNEKIKTLQGILDKAKNQGIEGDEENEREMWISKVKLATIKSVQAINMLDQEIPMLEMRAEKEGDGPEKDANTKEEEPDVKAANKKMVEKLVDIANKLSSKKVDLQAQVFKPSHILPKYTVEQAGMIELREMEAREHLAEQHRKEQEAIKASMDDDAIEEEELKAQRARDDWKDTHPTGYGNSKLRPCAL